MSREDRILVAVALLIGGGLVAAYVLAGGASYQPLDVADPCVPRESALDRERGTFEAIGLSALDGAACELQVPREDLVVALADPETTARFATEHQISDERLAEAVHAGMSRAIDDAEAAGRIGGLEATILREISDRAPVSAAISAYQALPGDDSLAALIQRVEDLGGTVGGLDLGGLLDQLPNVDPGAALDQLRQLDPGAALDELRRQASGDLIP